MTKSFFMPPASSAPVPSSRSASVLRRPPNLLLAAAVPSTCWKHGPERFLPRPGPAGPERPPGLQGRPLPGHMAPPFSQRSHWPCHRDIWKGATPGRGCCTGSGSTPSSPALSPGRPARLTGGTTLGAPRQALLALALAPRPPHPDPHQDDPLPGAAAGGCRPGAPRLPSPHQTQAPKPCPKGSLPRNWKGQEEGAGERGPGNPGGFCAPTAPPPPNMQLGGRPHTSPGLSGRKVRA